ncbi:MAG: thiamine-phosphate kinase [Candidatus Rokuibacteriota bacterium]
MTERPSEADIIRTITRLAGGRRRGVRVGIGDDCAVLELAAGARLVATTDLLVEDVHFRRRYASPSDIGWKAFAVNLSDIAAMGATPRWALVALACPEDGRAGEVEAFYEGALALASAHDVAIVGGDTSASSAGWMVNVTLLGEATAAPILRSGARPGDVLAVTGLLGRAAAGLAILQAPAPPHGLGAGTLAEVTGAHLRPRPRVVEGQWLGHADGVTAMMDLSDGLATDLPRLAAASGAGARVEVGRVPVHEATRACAHALGVDALAWATGGGEDYELLLACAPDSVERLAKGLAALTGARLTAIGEVTSTPGVRYMDGRGHEVDVAPGFEHFAGRGGRARA